MGMGMPYLEYLSERGHISRGSRILDIGSQNLYLASVEAIRAFVEKNGKIHDEEAFLEAAGKVSHASTAREGQRTSYISELLDLTEVHYTSFDICPALKTEIFDLNRERLPPHYFRHFDVVLNFGTTEHIFNQLNSFEVMHDALRVGGVFFHQLPSVGWLEHGYLCYHALFFDDLAKANGYEIVDRWYTVVGISDLSSDGIGIRNESFPLAADTEVPQHWRRGVNVNINVVLRKTVDAPFAVTLELVTSHSAPADQIKRLYGPNQRLVVAGDDNPLLDQLRTIAGALQASTASQRVSEDAIVKAVEDGIARALPPAVTEATQDIVVKAIDSSTREAIAATLSPAPAPDSISRTRTKDLGWEILRRLKTKLNM